MITTRERTLRDDGAHTGLSGRSQAIEALRRTLSQLYEVEDLLNLSLRAARVEIARKLVAL